jgi:hypothetical protein
MFIYKGGFEDHLYSLVGILLINYDYLTKVKNRNLSTYNKEN